MKKMGIILLILCSLTMAGLFSSTYIIAFKETVYSDDFNEDNFDKISVGMDISEVKEILGEPIRTVEQSNGDHLVYSESPNSTHYFKRTVLVQNSKVTEKVDELYID